MKTFAAEVAPSAASPASPSTRPIADVQADADFQTKITPLLQTYCYQCHGDGQDTGGLALDSFKSAGDVVQHAKTWDMLYRYVRGHQMPPSTEPQPTDAERKEIYTWVDNLLDRYYGQHPDPGRVTLHRLNRNEYNNTIRDLLGIDTQVANDFPADDTGYGFDNIGDVLSVPPLLMEKYLSAADYVMDQVIVPRKAEPRTVRTSASAANIAYYAVGDRGDGWAGIASTDDQYIGVNTAIPQAGEYALRVMACAGDDIQIRPGAAGAGRGGPTVPVTSHEPLTLSFMIGDRVMSEFHVTNDKAHPQVYEAHVYMTPDDHGFNAVVRRRRGGENEDYIQANGRPGRDQKGVVLLRYLEFEGPLNVDSRAYKVVNLPCTGLVSTSDGWRVIKSQGEASLTVDVPKDGDYLFRAEACASRGGNEIARDEVAQMELRANGQPMQIFDVVSPSRRRPLEATAQAKASQNYVDADFVGNVPQFYEAKTHLKAGKNVLSAAFLNPLSDPSNPDPDLVERSLYLRTFEVVALDEPFSAPVPAPVAQLFQKYHAPLPDGGAGRASGGIAKVAFENDPFLNSKSTESVTAARGIVTDFASRAWRRPAEKADVDRLMQLYDVASERGDDFASSIKLALKGVLVSPHFVYRTEPRPDPNDPKSVHSIDEFALASRLSYFLWSTAPDQELMDLASKGQLRQNLGDEVKRMLASPKSHEFAVNFASQWLQFRGMESLVPDKQQYPDFNAYIRGAMQKETELFFEYVMRQDRSVIDFVNGDYTFANYALAAFYGLPDVPGNGFQKVSLLGTPRRGLMTQGSVLLATSNPNRTSPVKRGKWVLENFVGSAPPPPPANVPPLDSSRRLTGTLRQRMEQHRADPACASCHALMDPIGFGLENFDGIGEYRLYDDSNVKIDSSGTLATGQSFKGALELSQILSSSLRDEFISTLSEKVLTYAMGRGVEYYDRAAIDQIVDQVKKNDCRFSSLISAVVDSVPFQMERGEGASEHPETADHAIANEPEPQ